MSEKKGISSPEIGSDLPSDKKTYCVYQKHQDLGGEGSHVCFLTNSPQNSWG